jgi:shikimate kinase
LERPQEKNIVLTGFMGTGKTTVGLRLAELMKRRFVDSDNVIVERAGLSIPQIFARDGEAGFRALEKEVCGDLAAQHDLVIATGGGMLVEPDNRARMLATGFVVCLEARPDVIRNRLALSEDRPLAGNWEALLEKRRAAYAAIPTHVDTSDKTPERVAQEIIQRWNSESASR